MIARVALLSACIQLRVGERGVGWQVGKEIANDQPNIFWWGELWELQQNC